MDLTNNYSISRGSSVSIVTRLRPGPSGIRFLAMSEDSSFLQSTHASSGAQLASCTITGIIFSGVKQTGREVDHTTPSGAEVKNKWSHTSSPPVWVW